MLVHRKVSHKHYDRRYQFPLGEERQCGKKFLFYGNNTTAEIRLDSFSVRKDEMNGGGGGGLVTGTIGLCLASQVLSKLPKYIHNSIYAQLKARAYYFMTLLY